MEPPSQTVTASGGSGTYIYMLVSGTLPDGLAVHTTTVTFSGTPSTVRNHSFTIAATDAALKTNIATYTLAVAAGVPGAPVIGTATAGDGEADVAFTALASNGGSVVTSYIVTSIQRPIAKSVSATVEAGSSANPIVCGWDEDVVRRNVL